MTSYYMISHVTMVTCLFIVQEKRKEKRKSKEKNIKSRKIDKKKRKLVIILEIIRTWYCSS